MTKSSRCRRSTRRSASSGWSARKAVLERIDPAARRRRHPVLGAGQHRRQHRRDDRRPERQPAVRRPRRVRLRGPGRPAGRHVLGVRRVRPVHHPLRPQRPAAAAALAVRRLAAGGAGQPRAEQGHGGPDGHPRRPDPGRHHAVRAAAARPDREAGNVTTLRIVTYDLRTHATHEYLYLLDDPKTNSGAVSEITALYAHHVPGRRAGRQGRARRRTRSCSRSTSPAPPTSARPRRCRARLRRAPRAACWSVRPGRASTPTSAPTTPRPPRPTWPRSASPRSPSPCPSTSAAWSPALDPTGGFFGHDKVEGVAAPDGGRTLVVSNDSDFGIDGVTNTAPPFQLHAKITPDGSRTTANSWPSTPQAAGRDQHRDGDHHRSLDAVPSLLAGCGRRRHP